jgi:hydrogenase-4 component F
MPPFGIFRSEFQIVAGGLRAGNDAPAAVLVVLVTVAFLGLALAATRVVLSPDPAPGGPHAPARGEPSWWMVVPVLAGVAALTVLGLHPPADLTALLSRGAAELGGGAR